VTLEIHAREVPLLPDVIELVSSHQVGGLKANRLALELLVEDQGDDDEARRTRLYDPQTSGGLLLLVREAETGGAAPVVGGREGPSAVPSPQDRSR
jgi:hypothetical protein